MKIEGDYLWDKTGEPDPEIQQLEEILGTLRYQPQALEIPADLPIERERKFFRSFAPGLAIAATIALVVLGLGLWFILQDLQRSQPVAITPTPNKPAVSTPSTAPSSNQVQNTVASGSDSPGQKHIDPPHRHRVNPQLLAGNKNQSGDARKGLVKNLIKDSAVAENNLQEGAAAKDQLLLGLRVACAKINFAQKKAQESTNPRDLIHNQHKIG